MRARLAGRFTFVALALLVPLGACGGSNPAAKTPESATGPEATPAPVVNQQGQQVGITPGPAGGDADLSGAAKDSYDRGFQAWVAGDLPGAKTAFSDAIGKAPKAAGPKYSLGCVLERLGDTQGALDAYRAGYSANGKYDAAIGAYALLLARTGHGPDAERVLGDKRTQNPDSVQLTAYLAEVKSIEGDSPGAQLLAQQALAKQPDFKDAMIVIARDYYRNHRWDLAKYALQAILDGADDGSIPPRDKDNPEALLLRGLIERDMGQRKEALADFEKAISKRPDLFEAYISLGEMKLEAGNATEAQGPLEKAVRYAPNVAVAHLDLGDCYRLLGRPADAKKELDKALDDGFDPGGCPLQPRAPLPLFSHRSRLLDPRRSTDASDPGARDVQVDARRQDPQGPGDDVDELLSTAKRKQGELQVKKQAAQPQPRRPPPHRPRPRRARGPGGLRGAGRLGGSAWSVE